MKIIEGRFAHCSRVQFRNQHGCIPGFKPAEAFDECLVRPLKTMLKRHNICPHRKVNMNSVPVTWTGSGQGTDWLGEDFSRPQLLLT